MDNTDGLKVWSRAWFNLDVTATKFIGKVQLPDGTVIDAANDLNIPHTHTDYVNKTGDTMSGNLNFGSTTRQMLNLYGNTYGLGVQAQTMYFRSNSVFAWYAGGSHNDAMLDPGGGTELMSLYSTGRLNVKSNVTAPLFTGAFSGDGARVTNVDAAKLGGSSASVFMKKTADSNLNMNYMEIDNINYLDIRAVEGQGLRFWGSDSYKISMGNSDNYHHGSVTDYSIKMNMSNHNNRGWTWGKIGQAPIASLSAGGNLTVSGMVQASQILQTSDIRFKKDIKPISEALSKITQLDGKTFTWKETGRKDIGLIAQEVEPIFPDVVLTDNNGYKSVEYANLVAPLIEAVKDLKSQLEEKDRQMAELKKRMKTLEEKIK